MKPAQFEVYRGEGNVRELAAGYSSVKREAVAVVARAEVAGGGEAAFVEEDRWTIGDITVIPSLRRRTHF